MSIANELSGDIAVANLAAKSYAPEKLNDLKQIILKVHSILQDFDSRNVKALFNPSRSLDTWALRDGSPKN